MPRDPWWSIVQLAHPNRREYYRVWWIEWWCWYDISERVECIWGCQIWEQWEMLYWIRLPRVCEISQRFWNSPVSLDSSVRLVRSSYRGSLMRCHGGIHGIYESLSSYLLDQGVRPLIETAYETRISISFQRHFWREYIFRIHLYFQRREVGSFTWAWSDLSVRGAGFQEHPIVSILMIDRQLRQIMSIYWRYCRYGVYTPVTILIDKVSDR